MPAPRLIPAAEARRVPWRNGRGVTEELAIGPPGASFERGDFDWRISRAGVAEAGPFSAFGGFDRVLVVTSGGGLVLDHGLGNGLDSDRAAPPARLAPLVPHRFSGDWPTSATLVDGAVTDFNVITRRGAAASDVRVLALADGASQRIDAAAGETFVHVVSGCARVTVAGGAAITVAARDGWHVGRDDSESRAAWIDVAAAGGPCVAIVTRIVRA